MKFFYLLTLMALFLISCNSRFENEFYNKLEHNIKEYSITRQPVGFDLKSITNFKWDKMLFIDGDESVPVDAEYIEKLIGQNTTDLDVNTCRFYFFYKTKLIKEIEIGNYNEKQAFSMETCLDQKGFLTSKECNFKTIPNSLTVKAGTIFLFPTCKEIPDALLKSKKD